MEINFNEQKLIASRLLLFSQADDKNKKINLFHLGSGLLALVNQKNSNLAAIPKLLVINALQELGEIKDAECVGLGMRLRAIFEIKNNDI